MKVVTVGGATQDIFIEYDNPETLQLYTTQGKRSFLILQEGKKIEITDLIYSTGGGATNSAVSFKRLGFDVTTVCKVGDDAIAHDIIKKLIAANINVEYVIKDPQHPTGISLIIPSKSGDRTILTLRGASEFLNKDDLPLQALRESNVVYVTSLSGTSSQQLTTITHEAKKNDALVALNPGGNQLTSEFSTLESAFTNIDILILNSAEANQLMASLVQKNSHQNSKALAANKKILNKQMPHLLQGIIQDQSLCFNLHQFFKEILAKGPRIVVVTNGAEGVYVGTHDTIYFHPSIPTQVINTVGAGDAFGSCFVASITQGKTMHEAMLRGILNSCSVISGPDAKTGLLTLEELDKKFAAADKNLLQTFAL